MDWRFWSMDSNHRRPGVTIRFRDDFLTSRELPLFFSEIRRILYRPGQPNCVCVIERNHQLPGFVIFGRSLYFIRQIGQSNLP